VGQIDGRTPVSLNTPPLWCTMEADNDTGRSVKLSLMGQDRETTTSSEPGSMRYRPSNTGGIRNVICYDSRLSDAAQRPCSVC